MNDFPIFGGIPSITLRNMKKTKRYGRTERRMDGWTDNSVWETNDVTVFNVATVSQTFRLSIIELFSRKTVF